MEKRTNNKSICSKCGQDMNGGKFCLECGNGFKLKKDAHVIYSPRKSHKIAACIALISFLLPWVDLRDGVTKASGFDLCRLMAELPENSDKLEVFLTQALLYGAWIIPITAIFILTTKRIYLLVEIIMPLWFIYAVIYSVTHGFFARGYMATIGVEVGIYGIALATMISMFSIMAEIESEPEADYYQEGIKKMKLDLARRRGN